MIDESGVACIVDSARQLRGISCDVLARRIGVDGKRLWYVLHGQREMRVDEFVKLCAFFNLGLGCFIASSRLRQSRSNCPDWKETTNASANKPMTNSAQNTSRTITAVATILVPAP